MLAARHTSTFWSKSIARNFSHLSKSCSLAHTAHFDQIGEEFLGRFWPRSLSTFTDTSGRPEENRLINLTSAFDVEDELFQTLGAGKGGVG